MIELRDLILRLRRGEGIKSLHRTTGRHKTVLRRLKALANEQKWTLEGYPVPTENEIQALWFAKATPQTHEGEKAHPLDAIKDEIDGWVKEKYSLKGLHNYFQKVLRTYKNRSIGSTVLAIAFYQRKQEVYYLEFCGDIAQQ